MTRKVLIANRGEIATRIARTAHRLGLSTVAVFADPDEDAEFVTSADEAFHLPGGELSETYLNIDRILAAAKATGADAVHPGYGFLSENAAFAQACADAGLVFVGPSPAAIEAMGDKVSAKKLMADAGVPVLPGEVVDPTDLSGATAAAERIGFPVLVKAAFGGGGKGMRIVEDPADLAEAVESAARQAAAAFGNGTVFLERYVSSPRHIEVQIVGDADGEVVHLFERECSIQRRYQKILEECPSPAVDADLREKLGAAAVAAGRAIDYTGVGTVEFVAEESGAFYFLEMNTRLQVEHPVTELVTGLDLVAEQLRIASGARLSTAVREATVTGHAIEVRLYAEDVSAGFLPATGVLHRFAISTDDARVDSGVRDGTVIGPHYDPMLAKVIAHGTDRAEAARRLARTLTGARVHGVTTNRDLLVEILTEPEFLAGKTDTGYLDRLRIRHPESSPDTRADDPTAAHAIAAALSAQSVRRESATVLPAVRSGFRNVFDQPQQITYSLGERAVEVAYRFTRGGPVVTVDGQTFDSVRIRSIRPTGPNTRLVDLDIDGRRRLIEVHAVAETYYVDSRAGSSILVENPRFSEPTEAELPGSLYAPMPGTVARVLAEVGATVTAGQPLLILEAMKMEHTVSAPSAGHLAELLVAAGNQVESGAVLAVVTED